MAYWLLKSEPDTWSYDDQKKKGAKGDAWTGVRNFTARRHLKEMKKGDRAFFYHTGDEKQVDFLLGLFLQGDVPAAARDKLLGYLTTAKGVKYPAYWSADDVANRRTRALAHLVLTLPEYQLN